MSVLDEFNLYKLNTKFSNGHCQHMTQAADSTIRATTWRRVKVLGRGGFGTVWLEKEEGGALRAVKTIEKTEDDIWTSKELLALTQLNTNPEYFVRFFGWYENETSIFIAMEYVAGGDLAGLVLQGGIPESDIKIITRQVLEGLDIMHKSNFCHRDLKPQNILVVSVSPIVVKITDFGISKRFGENSELQTMVGTNGYAAPEIWGHLSSDTSIYTNAVDIWSLGCLIYAIIAGKPPFRDPRDLRDYVQSRIRFPRKELIEKGTSLTAIGFISDLMRVWPDDRLTAEQALNSKWLRGNGEDTAGSLSLEPSWEYVQELLGRIKDHKDNTAKLHALENEVEELNLELEETRNESIRLATKSAVEHKSERGLWTQELDEWRGQTTRLREDLDAERKQHEFDLVAIKRDLAIKEADRQALERDLNELRQLVARSDNEEKKSKENTATNSKILSRRERNQLPRPHDLEFAAEISQGLLVEVRRLQALLSERDEALKITQLEKVRLEQEISSGSFRIRALDESEQTFKEENWNLELENQELRCLISEHKHDIDKLHALIEREANDKDMALKDSDEWKTQNERLYEVLEAEHKQSDFESAAIGREFATKEVHELALEKKVAYLMAELAKSHNQSIRLQSVIENSHSANLLQLQPAQTTPEHSPSPLPISSNTGLASDPLKPNLQDAHQMNDPNILQGKTEKLELGLSQDANDGLDCEWDNGSSPTGTAFLMKSETGSEDTVPGPAANKQNEFMTPIVTNNQQLAPRINRARSRSRITFDREVLWNGLGSDRRDEGGKDDGVPRDEVIGANTMSQVGGVPPAPWSLPYSALRVIQRALGTTTPPP